MQRIKKPKYEILGTKLTADWDEINAFAKLLSPLIFHMINFELKIHIKQISNSKDILG